MSNENKEKNVLEGNLKDTNIVQKSNSLFSLWKSSLTLAEFKILDTYLSRINSHEPDQRTVIFEKGELEHLLELKQIKPNVLDDRLKNLMTTVRIDDNSKKNGFTRISLFEKAVVEQEENKIWKAELTCTPSAMKYIFNIENIGYLRYKIHSVINISSMYSYIMFNYLEYNRFRGSWNIEVDKLKKLLNCDNEETYKEYKRFNDLILKKCHKELNEKTECKFTYEPIKKGRNIIAIKFTLTSVPNIENKEYQLEFEMSQEKSKYQERVQFLSGACDNLFSEKEMAVILDILKTALENDFYDDVICYDYLESNFNILQLHSERKEIKDKFAYFKKIIDIKE